MDIVEGDLTLLRELVNVFLADTPVLLTELKEAVARRDARRIASLAHRLRGSVANFQAQSAITGAQQLEEMASRNELLEVDTVLTNFERSTAELVDGLKGLRS